MSFKNIMTFALCGILAVSLCGCGNGSESSDSTSYDSTNSESTNSEYSEISESVPDSYPAPDNATFLKGAAGDFIGLSELTAVWDLENREISPEAMTEENFFRAFTNSAYYAPPMYPCLTSLDSEFDEDALLFKDVPQGNQTTFLKVRKGDKIFGLTVAEASSEFNINAHVFNAVLSTSLTLEGEITLSGYVRVVPNDEYGVSVGDILFIPVGDVQLPVVQFDDCDDNGVISRRTGDVYSRNGITYTNEFADCFVLGNISDTTVDVSILPADGSFIKVNVTISDIRMSTTANWLTQVNANIISISAAD